MKKLLSIMGIITILTPLHVQAAEYYVAPAPSGNDNNAGTEEKPFATIQRAQNAVSPGDTVFFR